MSAATTDNSGGGGDTAENVAFRHLLPGLSLKPVDGKDLSDKDMGGDRILVCMKQMDNRFKALLESRSHLSLLVTYVGGIQEVEEEVEKDKKFMRMTDEDSDEAEDFLDSDDSAWQEDMNQRLNEPESTVDHIHDVTKGM